MLNNRRLRRERERELWRSITIRLGMMQKQVTK
jgi:hypothetical protein